MNLSVFFSVVIFALTASFDALATSIQRRDIAAPPVASGKPGVSGNNSAGHSIHGVAVPSAPPLKRQGESAPVAKELSARPPLSLAQPWREVNVAEYLVSEKYDGARVWWDGRRLLSRGGQQYIAPAWFIASLPDQVLDRELWAGRGQFQTLMRTIRDQQPDEDAWRTVRFMVFDAPKVSAGFAQRQTVLARLLSAQPAWVQQVPQHRLTDSRQLRRLLSETTAQGGEGLILQRADAFYFPGRHSGFLKLKPFQDAEAVVVGYSPGKGKYRGMTGALIVVDPEGRQFKLGSGLSDKERAAPPAVGAEVTYRYQGRTASGKPRFARYLRVREE